MLTHLENSGRGVEVEVDGLERYFIRVLHLEHTHDHLPREEHRQDGRFGQGGC